MAHLNIGCLLKFTNKPTCIIMQRRKRWWPVQIWTKIVFFFIFLFFKQKKMARKKNVFHVYKRAINQVITSSPSLGPRSMNDEFVCTCFYVLLLVPNVLFTYKKHGEISDLHCEEKKVWFLHCGRFAQSRFFACACLCVALAIKQMKRRYEYISYFNCDFDVRIQYLGRLHRKRRLVLFDVYARPQLRLRRRRYGVCTNACASIWHTKFRQKQWLLMVYSRWFCVIFFRLAFVSASQSSTPTSD